MSKAKVSPNDFCPCGRLRKYKKCCQGNLDWEELLTPGHYSDRIQHYSTRGRNLLFLHRICDLLGLASKRDTDLKTYKEAFTAEAVRRIHEALMDTWPPFLDLSQALKGDSDDTSGLYIGDYTGPYVHRGIVRHSIYANKILIVDPFVYPASVRDEFNPILNPNQYRSQTLKNVNFWFALAPWIDAGIVEVIRTPADLNPRLNWESLKRQKEKFANTPELREAVKTTADELKRRHFDEIYRHDLLLSAPDEYLEQIMKEAGLEEEGFTVKDFLVYVQELRDANPNFLEPSGIGPDKAQIHTISSGTSYDIAQLTAKLTGSYLITDLPSKWREIELDRKANNAESAIWSPFAKALQESTLKCLNNVGLEHALTLRKEKRLESLRGFFLRVWKAARADEPFDERNVRLFTEELRGEIAAAEDEWKKIDHDLITRAGPSLLAAGGSMICQGSGFFLAAATAIAGVAGAVGFFGKSLLDHKNFPSRFPASFFLKLDDK